MTYKPKYKPNQLILGTGNGVIVSGWTPAKFVASKLDKSQYAAIGNLYSPTRGISPLLRNLFLNPQVKELYLIADTKADKNSGSVQCLYDFFKEGFTKGISDTGKECWVINSNVKGYIDIEISKQELDWLRDKLYFFLVTLNELPIYIDGIEKDSNTWWFREHKSTLLPEPLKFPDNEVLPTVLPGITYGHRIEGKTIAETWVKILHRIKTTGIIRPTGYDGQVQELIDLVAIVTDEPEDFYFPEPNYLPLDREFLTNYIPQVLEDAPYVDGVKYTYGQRLRSWFGQDQVERVIEKLIKEIDSASAVMNLWDSGSGDHNSERAIQQDDQYLSDCIARFGRDCGDSDHDHGGSPCLNHIWLRVIDNKLSLTATFRSNDMFSAWTSNAMGLRALQHHIRNEINKRSEYHLESGPLITISQSAHIYDDCFDNVDHLINTQYQKLINKITYDDPCGNFLIELENKEILVTQTTPSSGEIVAKFTGKNPLQLIREIAAANPVIEPQHIGYLGIELERAKVALEGYGTKFIQDETPKVFNKFKD